MAAFKEGTAVREQKKSREWLWCAAFLLIAALVLRFAAAVLRPIHVNYGSTWDQYLAEPKDSIDVLYLGSSYAYCDWNPAVIYDESGLTGYVMAGGEQTVGITYWYLKEALKTQSPKVVVMEGTGLFFDRYQNYTQINLGYMPWGLNKARAILECAEPEKKLGLFFDLYFYHDRWKELTAADVEKAVVPAQADDWKGHTGVAQIFQDTANGPFISQAMRQTEEVYQQNLADFSRIAALCREEGIDFYVTLNPTYSQYVPEVYDRLKADVEANEGVTFLNWADGFEEMGIDPTIHLYDGGHLNRDGAAIFSRWTGRWLLEQGYTPRAQTAENTAAWEKAVAYWENELG